MKNKNIFSVSRNVVTVSISGITYTLSKAHPFFDVIKNLLTDTTIDWERIATMVRPQEAVLNYVGKHIHVSHGKFYYKAPNGRTTQLGMNAIVSRIIEMFKNREDVEPMLKFLDNVASNPNPTAIQELFLFLEDLELPITEDGHFLAYKRVQENYTDCFSGTFDNSIGKIVEMNREDVDENRERTCSVGLHFCAKGYLKSFLGERTVVVKINPADVVSIPSDYANKKGRCCRYEVVGEIENPVCTDDDNNIQKLDTFAKPVVETKEEAPVVETKEEAPVVETKDLESDKKLWALPEDIVLAYQGTIKSLYVDLPKDNRRIDKPYLVHTPKGYAIYYFDGTTSNRAFRPYLALSNEQGEEWFNKCNVYVPETNAPKTESESVEDTKNVVFYGELKKFFKATPKEQRSLDCTYTVVQKTVKTTYRFVGKTTERALTQISRELIK